MHKILCIWDGLVEKYFLKILELPIHLRQNHQCGMDLQFLRKIKRLDYLRIKKFFTLK